MLPSQGSSDSGNRALPPSPPAVFFGGIGPLSSANWPPSRRREEARALSNLQKRVGSCRVKNTSSFKMIPLVDDKEKEEKLREKDAPSTSDCDKTDSPEHLDNRLQLLKKIFSNRPLSIVNSVDDSTDTDWYTSEFVTECLCWHNVYRQRHGAPPLSMCPDLCSYAQEWANTLAHMNTFFYRPNARDIGQNVYCRLNVQDPGEVSGQEVASYWYSACRQYDYLKEPDVLHVNVNAGHFIQMIWASSCDVGIGIARSRSGKVMVVANYRPPGNISGQFQENVLPPLLECSSDGSSEHS